MATLIVYRVMFHHDAGVWYVKKDGADRASFTSPTKEPAVARGRELAITAKGELIVHLKNGQIEYRNTYKEPDPFPPRG